MNNSFIVGFIECEGSAIEFLLLPDFEKRQETDPGFKPLYQHTIDLLPEYLNLKAKIKSKVLSAIPGI